MLASLASRDQELVLGVADALLDLPAVRRRLAAVDGLELGLRGFELLPRTGVVDLVGADRVVDQRDGAVVDHLKEAGTGRELEHVRAAARMDARRAGLQRRDQRRVTCED